MKTRSILVAHAALVLCSACAPKAPQCPNILGVAHFAFYTSDFESTCQLYGDFLGYENPYTICKDDGEPNFTIFKINDHQYVEVFNERDADDPRFYHFAIEVDDAEAMRLYLQSKGVEVPETTPVGRIGNRNFFVKDPNGVICEIVEYAPDSRTVADFGSNMTEARASVRMSHVGFQCPDLDKAVSFYTDILGFEEVWRGGADPAKVSWVHLGIPGSGQTLELMLYESEPDKAKLGSMNHLCLEVDDFDAALETLNQRSYPEACKAPVGPKTGINKKRQINYYDPDGTRVEVMSRETVDGIPAEPSKGVPMKYIAE